MDREAKIIKLKLDVIFKRVFDEAWDYTKN